ncbi:SPOSA6832_02721 [Sporobolomyces salmonicolor]|uniref:NADH dehydrogenase [ubiquinone] iron-sulfur protein 5 n=1 Tax=Sporidiobolus salmonicolor TaxID=5005 RepID=A0A0D6EM02_SPOSA|nr:SPOSA6832_02721 [Sporobolomyces salmonicolor]
MASGFGYNGGRSRCFPFWQGPSFRHRSAGRSLGWTEGKEKGAGHGQGSAGGGAASGRREAVDETTGSLCLLVPPSTCPRSTFHHFQKCYVGADAPEQCTLQKEDYLECLHHTKEVSRAMKIKTEYLTKTAHELEAKRKQAEQHVESGIMGLGLLNREEGANA